MYNHVVGYAAAAFTKEGTPAPAPLALAPREKKQLLAAARQTLAGAGGGRSAVVPLSSDPRFNLPAAVDLTLRGPDGAARGESATARPEESLLEAVVHAAAGLASPQAAGLKVELSVLSPLREAKADSVERGDGVVLEADPHTGMVLPSAWTPSATRESVLDEACRRAALKRGCWRGAAAKLSVFSAQSFAE
jgi:AMMECR1 domain-containing protein